MATQGQLSQIAVKVLEGGTPEARLSQIAVKVLESGTPNAQLSQIAVKVLLDTAVLASTETYKIPPAVF